MLNMYINIIAIHFNMYREAYKTKKITIWISTRMAQKVDNDMMYSQMTDSIILYCWMINLRCNNVCGPPISMWFCNNFSIIYVSVCCAHISYISGTSYNRVIEGIYIIYWESCMAWAHCCIVLLEQPPAASRWHFGLDRAPLITTHRTTWTQYLNISTGQPYSWCFSQVQLR